MLRGYLELLRPPNVVTAVADVLAGYAVSGRSNPAALPWLIGATACLYAGGVVLNDYFDRHLDAVERPERPLPSGRVPAGAAAALGGGLLVAGIGLAARATLAAGVVAAVTAGMILLYDRWGKRHAILGPMNMGLLPCAQSAARDGRGPGGARRSLGADADSLRVYRGRDARQPGGSRTAENAERLRWL